MARHKTKQTYESLKARTIEVGDCWEWQGYLGNKVPSVSHDGKMTSVRKLFSDLMGRGYKAGGFFIPVCNNVICVNPEHTRHYTQKQFLARAAKRASNSPTRAIKIQIYKRATASKLNETKAAEIRASDRPSRELAKVYGVDKSLICKIRKGLAWVNLSGNPFGALMR